MTFTFGGADCIQEEACCDSWFSNYEVPVQMFQTKGRCPFSHSLGILGLILTCSGTCKVQYFL